MFKMKRLLIYLWAAPVSALGLIFVPLARLSGGRVQVVTGVIEVSGGFVTRFLTSPLFVTGNAGAMTLGHVVLARDDEWMECSRLHERVHVKQYERWGALMIPLYLISSAVAHRRGGHAYWDNHFEQEAYAQERLAQ